MAGTIGFRIFESGGTETEMSKLYYTEEGRVLPSLCEELTIYRRARKTLTLPATAHPGRVYILARSHGGQSGPLRVSLNGNEVAALEAIAQGAYCWYDFEVDGFLEGENVLELWTDVTSMTGWSLGTETGCADSGSSVSDDGGKAWRKDRMGYLNAVLGEYVLRVRLEEGEDPPPPPMIWEDTRLPKFDSLREILPPVAKDQGPDLQRIRAISSWLASSWEHTNSARAVQYAPWDAETLLAWGPSQVGHNGKRPIAMCVHYAAALVSCAQAVGIPARCAVLTEAVNGFNGHFVTEVWLQDYGKWAVVDPNADAMFWKNDTPMSMNEVQAEGENLKGCVEYGKGAEFQRTFPHMVEFVEDNLEKGVCFGHRSVWFRSDLISHPENSPPGHGCLSYCETGLVWEERDLAAGFGMFPFFGDRGYFDSPPLVTE